MLEKVKLAMRISHSKLDGEISDSIEAAKADMIRAGVPEHVVDYEGPLVTRAVKTYCMSFFSIDQVQAERYMESYRLQLDNLRKSGGAY